MIIIHIGVRRYSYFKKSKLDDGFFSFFIRTDCFC
jgi:hypothetical protein